jgi:hypothetical protein
MRCLKCLEICDVIEVDHGGKEEIWGRMQHVPQMVDVSECCEAEMEIAEETNGN